MARFIEWDDVKDELMTSLSDKEKQQIDELTDLYAQAKQDYDTAQQAFDNAEGDYIDVATHRLKAALLNLNAITKELKNNNI